MSTLNTNFFLFKCFILCNIIYTVDEILYWCPLKTEEQGTKYQKITYRVLMAIKYHSMCKRQSLKDSRAVNLKLLER
jgi:hypothetical protein